jgi:6-pyruvoyl-tetrahydropterin synthase
LHGHTWTVRAFWSFDALDENGMGANFRDLKQVLRTEVHDRYDHRHLNDISRRRQPRAGRSVGRSRSLRFV